jgi:hypothetical protein
MLNRLGLDGDEISYVSPKSRVDKHPREGAEIGKGEPKGSKWHVQDLVKSADFRVDFKKRLFGNDLRITDLTCWNPNKSDPRECSVPTFLKNHWPAALLKTGPLVRGWWLVHGNRTPQWDLLCLGRVEGEPETAVIMVEAKAHLSELEQQDRCTSENVDNRCKIAEAILEAAKSMELPEPRKTQALDEHYQFRNRLTWAHRLASHGVPVVLVYLGFTNDPCWPSDPFLRNAWGAKVEKYAEGILPGTLDCGTFSFNRDKLWFRTVEVPVAEVCPEHARRGRR